jgi:hypothetical protein
MHCGLILFNLITSISIIYLLFKFVDMKMISFILYSYLLYIIFGDCLARIMYILLYNSTTYNIYTYNIYTYYRYGDDLMIPILIAIFITAFYITQFIQVNIYVALIITLLLYIERKYRVIMESEINKKILLLYLYNGKIFTIFEYYYNWNKWSSSSNDFHY